MYRVVTPQTEAELEAYYYLRWQLLRKSWQQPLGSERDEFDEYAHHRMMVDKDGRLVAVGRLYMSGDEAQIRFMAVAAESRGHGLGTRMVQALEQVARQQGARQPPDGSARPEPRARPARRLRHRARRRPRGRARRAGLHPDRYRRPRARGRARRTHPAAAARRRAAR